MCEPSENVTTYISTPAQIRVTYAEVDKMGVVYYGNYLRWFEIGRAEYIRARGKSYKEMEGDGFILPVLEAYARYRASAVYDDLLEIQTVPLLLGQSRIKFGYKIIRPTDDTLLAEGYTEHACMSPNLRVKRFPKDILQLLANPPLVAIR